jgi:hypothetical protein
LKGSNVTSARATEAPRATGRSSARPRPTPTSAEEFVLSGPSNPPDPDFNAYRKDLADVALVDRVIASHYAEPLMRAVASITQLRREPCAGASAICDLAVGEPFEMLDDSLGWAWGYACKDRRVGYVPSEALAAQ